MSLSNLQAAELFKQLAAKAGFSDDQVKLALNADEWKELQNRDNRHSEYSSALDRVKNLEPLATKATEWDKWWKEGGSRLYQAEQEKSQALARYQERFGNLDPNDPADVRRGAAQTGMTMEQVQAMLAERDNQIGVRFSAMTNDLLAVTVDAQQRGIKLSGDDVLAMQKIMAEKGVGYGQAYELHAGPRVREMESQRLQKEKEDYANEKVQDALTRAGVHGGIPTTSDVPNNFFDRPTGGVADKPKTDQELMQMWNEAGKQVAGR